MECQEKNEKISTLSTRVLIAENQIELYYFIFNDLQRLWSVLR